MILKKGVILFPLLMLAALLSAQQLPFYPTSYRLFSPAIFNPAMAGSRDYANINLIANVNGTHKSQTLSGNGRLLKGKSHRLPAPESSPFSNFGAGGYAFNEVTDSFRNVGGALSLAYHIPVTQDKLSFLSIGISGKGIYSIPTEDAENPDTTGAKNNIFTPDVDFGIYFYSARFYAGISTTNFLSNPTGSHFPVRLENTLSRQYFLTTGYRIILSKKRALLLEPSLLMNFGTSSSDKSSLHYHPGLKLYYKNSYIGYYLNDLDNFSCLLHVQTPWFYVGTYVEFPWSGDIIWYNGNLNIELSVGMILGRKHAKVKNYKFW